MVTTPGGVPALDTVITGLVQVTALATGFGGLLELGISLRNMLHSMGATTEEANAALAAFDAALAVAIARNTDWLASHPRTVAPPEG